jgi:ribosomal-protein-alanine N-acetyltransferase
MQLPEVIPRTLISLRHIAIADAPTLFAAADHPDVMKYMDWAHPKSVSDTLTHLQKADTAWAEATEFQWAILDRITDELVGTISCRPKAHAADFGYFLSRNHWGKGYATDAVRQVVELLFAQTEIIRVWATADAENNSSRRVLERAGLRLEGFMRMATLRPNLGGPPRDTALYARCRGDA